MSRVVDHSNVFLGRLVASRGVLGGPPGGVPGPPGALGRGPEALPGPPGAPLGRLGGHVWSLVFPGGASGGLRRPTWRLLGRILEFILEPILVDFRVSFGPLFADPFWKRFERQNGRFLNDFRIEKQQFPLRGSLNLMFFGFPRKVDVGSRFGVVF